MKSFFHGWIIVIASFCILTMAYGVLFSYGVFFAPLIAEFGWSRAITSSAFSINVIAFIFLGIPIGWLYDRYGPRLVLLIGSLLVSFGIMLCSQVTSILHLFLFYGIITGIGMAAFFGTLTSTVAKWFMFVDKDSGLPVGFAVSGIGLGTLIIPPTAGYLITIFDWRMVFIIIGIALLLVNVPATIVIKLPPKEKLLKVNQSPIAPSPNGGRINTDSTLRDAIKTRPFWKLYAIFTLLSVGHAMLMVHIIPFAIDVGVPSILAEGTLGFVGLGSIVGRIVIGITSDKMGKIFTILTCCILQTSVLLVLGSFTNMWILFLVALSFGFSYGGWVAMETPVMVELFGLKHIGKILAIWFTWWGIAGLIGPILGGYIFDVTNHYNIAFLLCAGASAIAAVFSFDLWYSPPSANNKVSM